ncbi:MAG: hypothetical protein IPK26_09380 [Planctomycetes bacterium]|nr:hypothetical protein [Planctomycetota bacterium]
MNASLPTELLAAFDRGGDPLEDPQLRGWLEEHPEHLPAFAALRASLAGVAAVPATTVWPARPAWRRLPVLIAAGLLLAMGLGWFVASAFRPVAVASPTVPWPTLAAQTDVRSVVVSTHVVGVANSLVGRQQRGLLSRHSRTSHTVTGRPSPAVTFQSTVAFEESFAP